LPETPVFEKIQKNKSVSRFPFLDILKNEKKPLFLGIGIKVTEIAWAYLLSVFFPLWAVNNLGLNRADVMDVILIAVACTTIVIPLSGYISDIIGRRKIYIFTSILFGLLAYPIWASLAAGNIFWPIVVGIISSTIMLAPLAALLPELFRPETRYSGAGATNQIAAAIGGGIVPVVGTWLAVTTGHLSGIAILMIILSLITLVCSLLIKETYRKKLI
jgi:MHS family shikimate/dehydroshikimate transporter-like MFS transporter